MIHPTAVVDSQAQLADDVEIGPYTIIGPQVSIDSGTSVGAHCVITGNTHIGQNNRIFQFNSIGDEPQDKKYANEDTQLIIGNNNTVREFCTFNRGTQQGGGSTNIGHDNWIMAYVHIAHDCHVGDHIIFANNAALAGHVRVADWAILGGYSIVHQFCDIGAHSFLSLGSHINQSVPPFVVVSGEKASPRGINTEGLKRRGYSADEIQQLRRVYKLLYRSSLSLSEINVELEKMSKDNPHVQEVLTFLDQTQRNYLR